MLRVASGSAALLCHIWAGRDPGKLLRAARGVVRWRRENALPAAPSDPLRGPVPAAYSEAELRELQALVRPLREAYVLFNNTEMFDDARRFLAMC